MPGTLEVLSNAHINNGGEVEKRKAFVSKGQLPRAVALAGGTTLNAYSLQEVQGGLVTFGSADSTLSTVATGAPYVFPTGVTYQRLRHYLMLVERVSFGVPEPMMDELVCSCAYKGKAFAVAHFPAAGTAPNYPEMTIAYYDGQPLLGQSAGEIWVSGAGNVYTLVMQLRQQIAKFFGTDFTLNIDSLTEDHFDLIAAPGFNFDVAITEEPTEGYLEVENHFAAAVAAVEAIGSKVIANVAKKLNNSVPDADDWITITDSAGNTLANQVHYTTSLLKLAQDLASEVNKVATYVGVATTGTNKTGVLTVTRDPVEGDDGDSITLTFTCGNDNDASEHLKVTFTTVPAVT